jgi:hypothetical protein
MLIFGSLWGKRTSITLPRIAATVSRLSDFRVFMTSSGAPVLPAGEAVCGWDLRGAVLPPAVPWAGSVAPPPAASSAAAETRAVFRAPSPVVFEARWAVLPPGARVPGRLPPWYLQAAACCKTFFPSFRVAVRKPPGFCSPNDRLPASFSFGHEPADVHYIVLIQRRRRIDCPTFDRDFLPSAS